MPSHQAPDGRWHHTFSASWLKDYATCPEKARRRYYNITPRFSTAYTALGSAVHAGFEAALKPLLDPTADGGHESPLTVALEKLAQVQSEDGHVSDDKLDTETLVRQHMGTFTAQTLPHMKPLVVEEKFDLPIYEDGFRTIRLRGAIDCVDANLGVIDWKTAGSPHKVWEKERYEVQPTVYVWAWNLLTGQQVDHMRFVVFVHNKGVQEYTVSRDSDDVEWLKFKALGAARHVESGLPIWAMNDSGWWCSQKWCPAWDDCKGRFINGKEA
jgi:RecB family exonuclease